MQRRLCSTTVLQNYNLRRISILRRIWRVKRNGSPPAKNRETLDENHHAANRLQLRNTVVVVTRNERQFKHEAILERFQESKRHTRAGRNSKSQIGSAREAERAN